MRLKTVSRSISATTAIAQERRRISRDLHDSAIQPYLGLKLGLEALRRRLGGAGIIEGEVDELIHMAGEGITELRRYVGNLKHRSDRASNRSVMQGLRGQARDFSELYGLRVEVVAECDVVVSGRLFDEVMQIVREALANIRRHTEATRAAINLRVARRLLVLDIENDRGAVASAALEFHPRSIVERTRELGGRVRVWTTPAGNTVVGVQVPL
jgi:signal transduction histidine kinase